MTTPCRFHPTTAKRLLAQRGLRLAKDRSLGTGYFTRAYLLDSNDVAIITTDPMKMEFMRYAQENEDSPHFPRVKAIHQNEPAPARTSGWDWQTGKWVKNVIVPSWTIITEYLEHNSVLVQRALRRKEQGVWTSRVYSLESLVHAHVAVEKKGDYSFANALGRLMNWVNTRTMIVDMHSKNLMVRGAEGVVVINDPVVGKHGPQ